MCGMPLVPPGTEEDAVELPAVLPFTELRTVCQGRAFAPAELSAIDFGHQFWGRHSVGPSKGGAPKGWKPQPRKSGPAGWGPEGWGLEGWGGPNISRYFPSSAAIFFLLALSWCPFVEFWCLKRRGPEMCTFGVSHDNPRNSNCAHFRVTAFKNTNNFFFSKFWAVRRRVVRRRVVRRRVCLAEERVQRKGPLEIWCRVLVSGSVQVFGDENRNGTKTK